MKPPLPTAKQADKWHLTQRPKNPFLYSGQVNWEKIQSVTSEKDRFY